MPEFQPPDQTSYLANKDTLFDLLIDLTDYAIALLDHTGRIQTWNHMAAHLYGFSFSEVEGQLYTWLLQNFRLASSSVFPHSGNTLPKEKIEVEGWQERRGGDAFYAHIKFIPLLNKEGASQGYAMLTRDITDQKKLEEENRTLHEKLEEKVALRTRELAVANKELEAFSYSVSHDLRTPLRAISGFSIMLQEDYADKLDGEANRIINTIVRNTTMMGHLIDDLLSFSRMGRLTVVHENVSMMRIVTEVLNELLRNDNGKYNIQTEELPACKGDPNMLKQVWLNLIGNAVKYASKIEAPKIKIGSYVEGAFRVYFVSDNGAGFDMKYAGKLFGVFQRLHRTDEFEGTGLGLALAQRIVHKHGGEINGVGESGRGATFYFSIPI